MLKISAAILLVFAAGCSTTSSPKGDDALKIIGGLVSDASAQKVIDWTAKNETAVRGLAYLNKFAESDFNIVRTELRAVNKVAKTLGIPVQAPVTLTASQKEEVRAIIQDTEDRWINQFGWLRINPKDAANWYDNENPTLFTGQYLWLLKRLGMLEGDLRAKYLAAFRKQIKAMELQRGLYDRFPVALRGKEVTLFSHDENLGILLIDYSFDFELGYAKGQNDYGAAHDYVYLNSAWSALDQFDRPMFRGGQPLSKAAALVLAQRYGALVEMIRRGAGAPPSEASDLMLCAGFLTGIQSDCNETSLPILNVLRASVLKGQTVSLDGCLYHFNYQLKKTFKKGLQCLGREITSENAYTNLVNLYFGPQHPIHRLASFLPPGAF